MEGSMTHRVIAAVPSPERQRLGLTGRWRAGRFWPDADTVVPVDALDDATWAILMGEPLLHIREATAEEIEAFEAAKADEAVAEADAVVEVLMDVIPQLAAGDFTRDGQPKLKPLRKVAGIEDALITEGARDAAMRRLVEGGFAPPDTGS
jgi:hypothetical protein